MFNVTETGKRIKAIRGSMKQEECAEKLGISRAALSSYENGSRTMDIEILYKFSELFNVSADYMLGRTNSKSINDKERAAVDVTGLSENTIMTIKDLATKDNRITSVIDTIFESKYFEDFLLDIIDLLTLNEPERYFEFDNRHYAEERKLLNFFMDDVVNKFKLELLNDENLKGVLNNG